MAYRITNGHMCICNIFKEHGDPSSPSHRALAQWQGVDAWVLQGVRVSTKHTKKKAHTHKLPRPQVCKSRPARGAVQRASTRSRIDSVGVWQVADRPARMCERTRTHSGRRTLELTVSRAVRDQTITVQNIISLVTSTPVTNSGTSVLAQSNVRHSVGSVRS
jgi:hypothetical protein